MSGLGENEGVVSAPLGGDFHGPVGEEEGEGNEWEERMGRFRKRGSPATKGTNHESK